MAAGKDHSLMVRKVLKMRRKVAKSSMNDIKKIAVIPTDGGGGAEQGAGNVDKIRDILFGSQIKNYEARFARLEETLARETSELKDTMRRRFESVEGFFRKEAETLSGRLKAEKEERNEGLKTIARDLKSASDLLGKKILELDNKTAEEQSGLRQELMQESRKLLEEIRQKSDSLSALVERRADELRDRKLDRAALASLLTEVAVQLSEDGAEGGKPVRSAKIAGQ
jgi:chromosome segregation ATPase